jgi:hypothetical protein
MTMMSILAGNAFTPSASSSAFASATGGTLTTATINGFSYNIHTFTTVGSNSITFTNGGPIEVFMVGGGGGGGSLGGGGAGGAVMNVSNTIASGTYSLTVGDGGVGAQAWSVCCQNGLNTTGFGITCFAGGSGCVYSAGCLNTYNTASQGNFGGRCFAVKSYSSSPTSPSIPAGWSGIVYAGNLGGTMTGSCCPCNGAGGAGAGGAGSNHNGPPNGGPGVTVNFTGTSYVWAGGGGGSGYCSQEAGNGGSGGGGGGGTTTAGAVGTGGTGGLNNGNPGVGTTDPSVGGAGGNNTGAGGGAGSTGSGTAGANGGKGGSGIIIVRYRTS